MKKLFLYILLSLFFVIRSDLHVQLDVLMVIATMVLEVGPIQIKLHM